MKKIKQYILEKLIINKDTKAPSTIKTYWYGEMRGVDNLPQEFYDCRKSKRIIYGVQKNKPWYAVCICLEKNGPMKVKDIRDLLWPNNTGQQAELFSNLRLAGLIESMNGPDRGKNRLNDFSKWNIKYLRYK